MKEYDDGEIGEGVDEEDDEEMAFLDDLGGDQEVVGDDEMNDALDEFIDQNKNRFRNLHHNFLEGEDPDCPKLIAASTLPNNVLTAT